MIHLIDRCLNACRPRLLNAAGNSVTDSNYVGKSPLRRLLAGLLCCLVVSTVSASDGLEAGETVDAAVTSELTAAELEFFEKKIRPVLVEHCYECHAADAKAVRGGLLVDSATAFRAGGDSGPAVVPGDPEGGTLLDALRYETFEMPPKQKLPQHVIDDFEKWITQGAPDPRTGTSTPLAGASGIDLIKGRDFWSFRPLSETAAPAVQQVDWPRNDIDRWILAAQEARELQPAADADELTLLRRVTFDLTGLPPTLEEIEVFLADATPERWERTVDRLLDSPRFGEHWGRHWLDLARYADSTGGGRSLLYGEAWRYREYVIDAFNSDKPFDQFLREQIAGDLLQAEDYRKRAEQIIATAFLVLGPYNYENQDKEQLRMDVVDEQIDTIGRVFLAMTIGCARCHDHKFDPIPTADYYALAGIFRSTDSLVDGNVSQWVSTPMPLSPEVEQQRQQEQEQLARSKRELKQAEDQLTALKSGIPATVVDNSDAELTGEWVSSRSIAGFVGEDYQHSSDLNARARYTLTVAPGRYELQMSYTPSGNRTRKCRVLVEPGGEAAGDSPPTEIFVNQQLTPNAGGGFQSLGKFDLNGPLTVTLQPTERAPTIIDALRLIPLDGESTNPEQVLALRDAEQQVEQLRANVAELEMAASVRVKPPQLVSVQDQKQPEDYFICIRGNVHNHGAPVQRGFLSVVDGPQTPTISDRTSGRLELSNWLTDPQHPLTSRVFVNRVWQQLFGVGLVRTVDNFGLPGELPSHPELLDALARDFLQDWSVKRLIRSIVLSRTYQLTSDAPTPASDVDNRLLTRQNRKRLTAEALHDTLLLTSAELQFDVRGDTIKAGTRAEYGYQFNFGPRAVYLPVFRNRLPEIFVVFDFPDPNLSLGRRNSSTVSPQALFLMNSEFVQQRAQTVATRVLQLEESFDKRLDWLSRTTFSRPPTAQERELIQQFLADDPDSPDRWTQVVLSLYGSLDFRYVR